MHRTTNSKINTFFSFVSGGWCNWSDEPRPEPEEDTRSIQSFDSDASEDLWETWDPNEADYYPIPDWTKFNPEVVHKLIKTTRSFLNKLTARFAKDSGKVAQLFEQQGFKQTNEEPTPITPKPFLVDFGFPKDLTKLCNGFFYLDAYPNTQNKF